MESKSSETLTLRRFQRVRMILHVVMLCRLSVTTSKNGHSIYSGLRLRFRCSFSYHDCCFDMAASPVLPNLFVPSPSIVNPLSNPRSLSFLSLHPRICNAVLPCTQEPPLAFDPGRERPAIPPICCMRCISFMTQEPPRVFDPGHEGKLRRIFAVESAQQKHVRISSFNQVRHFVDRHKSRR